MQKSEIRPLVYATFSAHSRVCIGWLEDRDIDLYIVIIIFRLGQTNIVWEQNCRWKLEFC